MWPSGSPSNSWKTSKRRVAQVLCRPRWVHQPRNRVRSAKGRGARRQTNEELPHRRAEQAPFCAMFLRSTRTTRAGLLEGGRNLVSEGEHCDASQDGLGSYSREMNGAFMPD